MAAQHFSGGGDPNGVVVGSPGDTYQNMTPGTTTFWTKATGSGTSTGWVVLSASGGGGDLTWYGSNIDGNLVVPTGTVMRLPTHLHCSNVLVETGACLYLNAWSLHVGDTLTVEGTGTVEASGGNGTNNVGGAGGNTASTFTTKSGYVIATGVAVGANGLQGRTGGAGGTGTAGSNGANANRGTELRHLDGSTGGNGGASDVEPGGTGGITFSEGNCYSTPAVAMGKTDEEATDFSNWVSGGAGGGGGGGSSGGTGGGGGGGGGVGRLYARNIVCPDGAIKSTGGNGAPGSGEVLNGAGGGGAMGGTLLIITDGPFDVAVKCDVTGGNGGVGVGIGENGTAGDPGAVVALSPILGPL